MARLALEAAMVDKIDIYGVQNLRQTFAFLRGEIALLPTRADLTGFFATHQTYDVDFSDVKGQGHVVGLRHKQCALSASACFQRERQNAFHRADRPVQSEFADKAEVFEW